MHQLHGEVRQARDSNHLAAVFSKLRFDVALFMPCGYYASAKLLRAGDDLAEISRPVGPCSTIYTRGGNMKIFTMTKTVTKNLVTGPATLMYPQRERAFTAITRGRIDNAIEKCIFCGMCARRCPTYAITVTKENKTWQIDRLRCCICNLCVEVCPVKCLSTGSHYPTPVTAREMAIHRESQPLPSAPGEETAQE